MGVFFCIISDMFHNTKKKQIILVRHAKALELSEFAGMDFDRPLSDRWENSLKFVARYLRLIGVKPDKIIASPATRTKQTAEWIVAQFSRLKVELVGNLYNGWSASKRDSDQIHLNLVKSLKKDVTILMIVWHNDDLTNFAKYLSGDGVPSMKKWSVAVLSPPDTIEWKDIKEWSASFVYYLTPQFLRLEELV